MESHTRKSPGFEFKEIDRSRYDSKPDYSITPTSTLMTGFADKGEPYTVNWVNTIQTYTDLYGYPTNEPEKYLYNGVLEVMARRGRCLVARLPYANSSKDKFTTVRYKLDKTVTTDGYVINQLSSIDSSLTSYMNFFSDGTTSLIGIDDYDNYRTNNKAGAADELVIVDISRQQYGVLSSWSDKAISQERKLECLGVMPVFVSPVQAMFYQGVISSQLSTYEDGSQHTIDIEKYTVIADAQNRSEENLVAPYTHMLFSAIDQTMFSMGLSAFTTNEESVSRSAAGYFPLFNYLGESQLQKKYMKQLGLVVFNVFRDDANESKVTFAPVEAYVGSLDRHSKDPDTHASNYLGDIVNQGSKLINVFSNIKVDDNYKSTATIMVGNPESTGPEYQKHQLGTVLGFAGQECVKHIDYVSSIINPLTRILDRCQDPNQVPIDIVCDAGVSNIAQYVNDCPDYLSQPPCSESSIVTNADAYPFAQDDNPWKFNGRPARWHAVLKKFDDFCKYTRRDCIFIADGYRPLVLAGNEKIVRPSDINSSIKHDILPNLKYVQALNSSYSAGYCNWYHIIDDYSGDQFWCPPSIKAAGVYVYTDAYHHTWDAPAGLERGQVRGAFDTSFDPRNDEAGQIYQQAWNYAVNYPMEGIIIEGQKTFQLQPTALDRINVRRLMIYLEQSVAEVARRFLYEGNTEYLRQKFVDTIRPVFEDAVKGKGVKEYAIRCDDTLNTVDVIERNEMRCVIGVKPVKTVEWIRVDFVVTNQSANVSEEVIRA